MVSPVFVAGHPHREQGRVAAQGSESLLPAGPEEHRLHPGELGLLHWALSHRGEPSKDNLPVPSHFLRLSSSFSVSQVKLLVQILRGNENGLFFLMVVKVDESFQLHASRRYYLQWHVGEIIIIIREAAVRVVRY